MLHERIFYARLKDKLEARVNRKKYKSLNNFWWPWLVHDIDMTLRLDWKRVCWYLLGAVLALQIRLAVAPFCWPAHYWTETWPNWWPTYLVTNSFCSVVYLQSLLKSVHLQTQSQVIFWCSVTDLSLAWHTWWCPWFSAILEVTYKAGLRTLKGHCFSTKKRPLRVRNASYQLPGEQYSLRRVIDLPSMIFFFKNTNRKDLVSGETWLLTWLTFGPSHRLHGCL